MERRLDASDRGIPTKANVTCSQCGCPSSLLWDGWRAYRVEDPETDEPPALAFLCPRCARREPAQI